MVRTRKGILILFSVILALSLALMSCTKPAVEQPTGGGITVRTEQGKLTEETGGQGTTKTPEQEPEQKPVINPDQPKYGGTLNLLSPTNITIFMPGVQNRGVQQDAFVLEQILGADRTKGPEGTGETEYGEGVSDFKYVNGNLAESWSTPELGVWVLNIRQGVHFALDDSNPVSREVGGREMTAEDVAYSIEWMRDTPSSWIQFAEPSLIRNTTVERTGPWQITVRTPVAPTTTYLWIMGGGGNQYVLPKENLDRHGTDNDWHNPVGTGPYILKDFVSDSAATYVRNNNYWDINPTGPGKGDKLPYPDGINYLIVPDQSTRLAAIRTGKADFLFGGFGGATSWEDYEQLKRTNPDLQAYQTTITPLLVGMRQDLPDQPYSDVRVRQAMMLAIDHPGIIEGLFDGHARLLDSPAQSRYPTVYTPLEELNQTTQELYGYNPDKAKQLLADAGYPNGFKATMIIENTPESSAAAETIKAYWDAVGVELTLQVLESGAFVGTWAGHQTEDLILTRNAGGTAALFVRYSLGYYRGPNIFNISHVNDPPGTDPKVEEAFNIQAANVNINYPAADKAYKDLIPYLLEQAFMIPFPAADGYRIWQPWMKGYYGEAATKFWLRYVWVDQALKKDMGY